MSKLIIGDHSYDCGPEESVLEALLRQNVAIPYGCKKGVCQSCMVQSSETISCNNAQPGLKDTQIKQNYFLACSCVPEQDMTIKLPGETAAFTKGTVIVNEKLSRNITQLTIKCDEVMDFFPGQFVKLHKPDGLIRSYSISNTPQESNILEFHIQRLPSGRFSGWVHDHLKVGDTLEVSEPLGHCFYLPERKQQGLLLVGTGTGLAPLMGILTDALQQGHTGPIHLFHGSRELEDLYHIETMQQTMEKYENFTYTPCISGGTSKKGFASGRANDIAVQAISDLKGWRVFLCGHPNMINQMKKDAVLKGASINDIYIDVFNVEQVDPAVIE